MDELVHLAEVEAAAARLHGVAVRTPLVSYAYGEGQQLYFKPESLQLTGSFKLRGAYNAAASLSAEERDRGLVTYSSGNHAQAVACAAHLLGCPATIVMPDNAPQVKVEGTRGWGAEIVFAAPSNEVRRKIAEDMAAEQGLMLIPPYEDRRIIAGQGTVALEIVADLPNVAAVVLPIGGGGLISGVAAAIKQLRPEVKVYGVEPELAADAHASFRSGRLTASSTSGSTIADGLRTERVGALNFAHIQQYVDDIFTVSEEQIIETMHHLTRRVHLLTEPSGAVATAAVLAGKLPTSGPVVAIISGGNVEVGFCCGIR